MLAFLLLFVVCCFCFFARKAPACLAIVCKGGDVWNYPAKKEEEKKEKGNENMRGHCSMLGSQRERETQRERGERETEREGERERQRHSERQRHRDRDRDRQTET